MRGFGRRLCKSRSRFLRAQKGGNFASVCQKNQLITAPSTRLPEQPEGVVVEATAATREKMGRLLGAGALSLEGDNSLERVVVSRRRSTAARFFGPLVVAALPLVVGGCQPILGPRPPRKLPAALPNAGDLRDWGLETLVRIHQDLFMRPKGLYAQKAHLQNPDRRRPASVWSAAVQLSALCAGARAAPMWRPVLRRYANMVHRVHLRPGGGYAARVKSPDHDLFFDDNAWLALAFVETAETLNDDRFLVRARNAATFVLSGEDQNLGGGIYWRDHKRDRKNACSVAPAALLTARLYKKTRHEPYRQASRRLLVWLDNTLKDPADGLLWDHIKIDGTVDKAKRSYNTALYLLAKMESGQLPENKREFFKKYIQAAMKRWYKPGPKTFKGSLPFLHHLVETVLRLNRQPSKPVLNALVHLRYRTRDPLGRYPKRWEAAPDRPLKQWRLIDQASAARAYLMAAELLER